jgi:hypothetical protein
MLLLSEYFLLRVSRNDEWLFPKTLHQHHHHATLGMIDEQNLGMPAASVYLTLSTSKSHENSWCTLWVSYKGKQIKSAHILQICPRSYSHIATL